jgi:hypothetical protein
MCGCFRPPAPNGGDEPGAMTLAGGRTRDTWLVERWLTVPECCTGLNWARGRSICQSNMLLPPAQDINTAPLDQRARRRALGRWPSKLKSRPPLRSSSVRWPAALPSWHRSIESWDGAASSRGVWDGQRGICQSRRYAADYAQQQGEGRCSREVRCCRRPRIRGRPSRASTTPLHLDDMVDEMQAAVFKASCRGRSNWCGESSCCAPEDQVWAKDLLTWQTGPNKVDVLQQQAAARGGYATCCSSCVGPTIEGNSRARCANHHDYVVLGMTPGGACIITMRTRALLNKKQE